HSRQFSTRSSFCCSFNWTVAHRVLLSFPTRRSSDLGRGVVAPLKGLDLVETATKTDFDEGIDAERRTFKVCLGRGFDQVEPLERSEEHTSELQSRFVLVCRLLLVTKKRNKSTA